MTGITVQTERIDDVPLLIRQQQAMGIAEIIDSVVPRHGNREGLSIGWTVVGWLAFILSESDHRLSFVEEWAGKLGQTLSRVMGQTVSAKDFTDDRLGDVLQSLSKDAHWEVIESQLSAHLIRVYQLPQATARVDATTVSLYHDSEASALFAYGHSKDHRPDLAQIKVMMVTLDPMGLPIVTLVVPGNRADDSLYLPTITAAQKSLSTPGVLYVGDSKMEALPTRAHLVHSGDYYLLPLSQKGEQGQLLAEQVSSVLAEEELDLMPVYALTAAEGEDPKLLAQGKESVRQQEAVLEGEVVSWRERLLLIYSPALAQSGYQGLQQRLQQAEKKLLALTPDPGRGKRQFHERTPLVSEAEAIRDRHRVNDYLHLTYQEEVEERHIRRYRDRPARTEKRTRYRIVVERQEEAITTARKMMGWRLYVSNAPEERLSLVDAGHTYRGGVPTIEHDFSRLKGRPLGLRPLFVHRADHVIGLTRLLSLALMLLTLVEYLVRRSLQEEQESLVGLYPGNPTRATNRPTTERLLGAFKDVTLSIVEVPGQRLLHVTPLTPVQNRILQLLKFSDSLYTDLAQPTANSP
jgi:transposase